MIKSAVILQYLQFIENTRLIVVSGTPPHEHGSGHKHEALEAQQDLYHASETASEAEIMELLAICGKTVVKHDIEQVWRSRLLYVSVPV
jgi:hypothetical protein